MKTIPFQEWQEGLHQMVEKHLSYAVSDFQNLSPEALVKPEMDGKWSVAQCLEHLNSYGDYYLPAVEHVIANVNLNHRKQVDFYQSGWFGNYCIQLMEGSQKFKAFKKHVPPLGLDGHAVVARFIQQQEGWLRILEQCNAIDINHIRVPISISKLVTLRLGDVLGFVKAHDERHLMQAKRVLKTIGIS
jgi:hypothetical protein